jgi:NADH-quinone oxidoreductase subunit F
MTHGSVTKTRSMLDRYQELKQRGEPDTEIVASLAEEFTISRSLVSSITSFYQVETRSDKICIGLPCALKYSASPDSETIRYFKKESCLGYCDHAPVIRLGGKYFTRIGNSLKDIQESSTEFVMNAREDFSKYTGAGGYHFLDIALKTGDYNHFIDKLQKSGLKGMGGAGFPVMEKWKSLVDNARKDAYLLINGHEGEPGTFKDRYILEIYPHRVLEGAFLAAILNGLHNIIIALKTEYSNARKSIQSAMDELGMFYPEIFQQIKVEVLSVPGSYVIEEETALMESIEGKRGEPRLRPPFPTQKGLYGKPTIVHNVETVFHLPEILSSGDNQVSKFYSLTGDVKTPGIYKEKLGIDAARLVERHGSTGSETIKAFMPGGLSGGILPGSEISANLDFESLRKAGAGLGTGALIALSNDRCIVNVIHEVAKFFEKESCGKCIPCRIGTARINSILKDIVSRNATDAEIEDGKRIASVMIDGSICALGQVAGRTFIETISRFSEEFQEHFEGKCPAGVCFSEAKL